MVAGGANVDVKACSSDRMQLGTSNPGRSSMSPGGVARNIAENLARLGTPVHLVAAVGRDAAGDWLLDQTAEAGVRLELVHRTGCPTGTYVALLDRDGELVAAVSDMTATAELGPEQLERARGLIQSAGLLVLDANLPSATLERALQIASGFGVRIVLEPVSAPKAAVLAEHLKPGRPVFLVTPNRDELGVMAGSPAATDGQLEAAVALLHDRGVEHVWVGLGEGGSMFSTGAGGAGFLPAPPALVTDVTGAGDAMVGAFCHALLGGRPPREAARYGQVAAALTVASPHTVRPDMSPELIEGALASSGAAP